MIPATVVSLWARDPWLALTLTGGTALLALGLLVVVVRVVTKTARFVRTAAPNLKLAIGQALVQAGVTWAVVTGTYEFCRHVFDLPGWEAIAFSVFLEAATWVTVGMIYDHGKSVDKDGKPNLGFGPAGPFFFLFSVLGGVLAVIAGTTWGAMVGRAVIVVFGACLWYLALLRVTSRSGTPTRFRWTPRALLIAVGAMSPAEQDVRDEHHEWQVRRMARAMRWANGRWPWSWLGRRALTSRAEQTTEAVIESARRRYAVAHVVVSSVQPESEVMQRVITEVTRGTVDPATRDQLDEVRLQARQATTSFRREYQRGFRLDQSAQTRMVHGVVMPAHIADQIPDQIPADWVDRFRTKPDQPADQTPGPDQTTPADQTPDQTSTRDLVHARTSPGPADQTTTSGSVPASRTSQAQRTTVRVDRVRPVSPAAGGEVPPKVREMAKAIAKRYRGEIPSRSTVMDDMGWTSADYTGKAIKLVREERAARTQREN